MVTTSRKGCAPGEGAGVVGDRRVGDQAGVGGAVGGLREERRAVRGALGAEGAHRGRYEGDAGGVEGAKRTSHS
jgi:hypothetical protein